MNQSNFDNETVNDVSVFLQNYMKSEDIAFLTADEAALLLAQNKILPNDVGLKPGFNFRPMLRDGRDGLIDKISGVYQERPNTRWFIYRNDNKPSGKY
ncbi:MAG: hypothetical protein V1775_06230 [Bacteroidota bacterium]